MSKSLGNHIGIADAPKDMFGKLMSIPDSLMESYATLLTDLPWSEVQSLHPKAAKVRLAQAIVTQYHGASEAERQAQDFDRIFRSKELPADIPQIQIVVDGPSLELIRLWDAAPSAVDNHLNIKSKGELRRLVSQRGLKVDGAVATLELALPAGKTYTLQAGPRRFLKISLK